MSAEAKAHVRAFMEELGNKHQLGALHALTGPGARLGQPAREKIREQAEAFFRMFLDTVPDVQVRIEDQIAEGNKVVTRFRVQGTHKGDWHGPMGHIPGSGRPINFEGIHIAQIENGQIVENWTQWDRLGVLQQVGVVPHGHTRDGTE